MLQIANAFFKLPGDYLLPHEPEITGFQARLSERLSPAVGNTTTEHLIPEGVDEGPYDWNVHDCVAQWWRPNFETFMYPFIPAHVTRPKECKKMYLIQLPKKSNPPYPPSNPVISQEIACFFCLVALEED
jgi:cleavage and polyadenylation specificity factor subunit 5